MDISEPQVELLSTAIAGLIKNISASDIGRDYHRYDKKFVMSPDIYHHIKSIPQLQSCWDCTADHPKYQIFPQQFQGVPVVVNSHLPPDTFSMAIEKDIDHSISYLPVEYSLKKLKRMRGRWGEYGVGLTILVKTRAERLYRIDKNEWAAIETLREMISESDYRKYIKHGFILIRGASGKVYQIYRKNQHIKVWQGGAVVEELCVSIADYRIPLTDRVIALKTMIEISEDEVRRISNVYPLLKKAA
jgi:hypothetical protein